MNKRWLILGSLAIIFFLSWVAFVFLVINPLGYEYNAIWVTWIIVSCIILIVVAGATRPKKQKEPEVHLKEIINKKEVLVKVRCPYCNSLYAETLDRCPNCNASQ